MGLESNGECRPRSAGFAGEIGPAIESIRGLGGWKNQFDVVVVGAGPVGLLTAIELTLGGVRVLVLERLAAPSLVLKAGGIGPLGIEALQRRGMAAAIDAAEVRSLRGAPEVRSTRAGWAARGEGPRFSGHFAGLMLIRADAQAEPGRRMPASWISRPPRRCWPTAPSPSGSKSAEAVDVQSASSRIEDGVDVEWASPAGGGRDPLRLPRRLRRGSQPHPQDGRLRASPARSPTLTMYQADRRDRPSRARATPSASATRRAACSPMTGSNPIG